MATYFFCKEAACVEIAIKYFVSKMVVSRKCAYCAKVGSDLQPCALKISLFCAPYYGFLAVGFDSVKKPNELLGK